jgi:hypothetical protein
LLICSMVRSTLRVTQHRLQTCVVLLLPRLAPVTTQCGLWRMPTRGSGYCAFLPFSRENFTQQGVFTLFAGPAGLGGAHDFWAVLETKVLTYRTALPTSRVDFSLGCGFIQAEGNNPLTGCAFGHTRPRRARTAASRCASGACTNDVVVCKQRNCRFVRKPRVLALVAYNDVAVGPP